jgi:hypothetical protein
MNPLDKEARGFVLNKALKFSHIFEGLILCSFFLKG